jgi:hypothetical protein
MIRIQGIPVVTERLQAGRSTVRKLAGLFRARAMAMMVNVGLAWLDVGKPFA